jgi:hypothetical protein
LRTGNWIRKWYQWGYNVSVKKNRIALSILAAAAALVLVGCQVTRAGHESAAYMVVRSDGRFELRDYPALTAVETPMANPEGSDGSFMRLFRFISGANKSKRKITMTTPVFMSGSATNLTMAFVLPGKLKADAVPKPSDAAVTVHEVLKDCDRLAICEKAGQFNACGPRQLKRQWKPNNIYATEI